MSHSVPAATTKNYEKESSPSSCNGKSSSKGCLNHNESQTDAGDKNNTCDQMDVVYTNGYQNGCGVEEMDVEVSTTSNKKGPTTGGTAVEDISQCTKSVRSKSFENGKCTSNGNSTTNNGTNGHSSSSLSSSDPDSGISAVLHTGRELQSLSVAMRRIYGHNETNKELMENAFSLLAYADPWNSPVGWQLSRRQREPVCAALNSAILQSIELPRTPPLQVAINHAHLLISQQARAALGSCAFVDLGMHANLK